MNNKGNSFKFLLLIILAMFVTLTIIYIANLKYSLSEITADNYKTKLKKSKSSLFEAGLDGNIPEKFSLYSAKDYLTSDNFQNNGLRITNNKTGNGNHVEIHSERTNLNYWIDFTEGNMTNVWMFKQALMDPNSPPTPLIKETINNLILNKGFILKRPELKNGSDVIIKETEDCFIIGTFFSYDDPVPVSDFAISTFNKRKYF